MSVALQSLMREAPSRPETAPFRGGLAAFVLIGGGAAASFVTLSSLLVWILPQMEGWIISATCYAAFIVPVYLLHRRYSFASEAAHRQALPRYMAVQAMALMLAALFGLVFHGTLALPSLPAAILVIVLTSGVNYLVLKGWAFAVARRLETVHA